MSNRAGRAQRVWRGVAAAAIATFAATVSHSASNGQLPPLANVLLSIGLALPVCVLMAGRRLSWWRLSIAVIVSQALFHALLSLDLDSTGAMPAVVGPHHEHLTSLVTSMPASVGDAHQRMFDSPWMLIAHVFAAVATIIVLGSGEKAIRELARLFSDRFRALTPVLVPVVGDGAPRVAGPDVRVLRDLAVLSVMRRRGPPVLPA